MTYAMQPPVRNGFTLIEIVSVLVVLGVLAYLGVSAFQGNDGVASYAERDKLLSQLVYARAQGMAIGGGQCVNVKTSGVDFSTAKSSTLPTQLKNYMFSATLQSGATEFCFDAVGSACAKDRLEERSGTDILYCSSTAQNQEFNFGGGSTITLFAETGFVQ